MDEASGRLPDLAGQVYLSCSSDVCNLESTIEPVYLDNPRVSKGVPHLSLSVRGPVGRPFYENLSFPRARVRADSGPTGPDLGAPQARPREAKSKIESAQ